jgi:hypothetical protein
MDRRYPLLTDELPLTKICTKCGVEKLLEEFNKSKTGKFGRFSWCRICSNVYQNAKRKEKADEVNRKNREKLLRETAEERGERLKKDRAWRSKNKERRNEAQRNKYNSDPVFREQTIALTQQYYREHREEQVRKANVRVQRRVKTDLNFRLKHVYDLAWGAPSK